MRSEMKWRSWALRGWLCTGLSVMLVLAASCMSTGAEAQFLNRLFQELLYFLATATTWSGLMVSILAHHSALKPATPLEASGDYFAVAFHTRWRLVAGVLVALVSLGVVVLMGQTLLEGI